MPSEIRVDSIQAADPSGPVIISYGASIPSTGIITGSGGINVTGVVTATSFSGSGSGLTNLTMATESKVIAFSIIT
jgi:hypothetical protein